MSIREEFEKWITTTGLEADLSRGNHGCYLNPPTHWLYCAWVGSRAAIEIELPAEQKEWSPDECAETDGFNDALDRCASAIESAGLKVKP